MQIPSPWQTLLQQTCQKPYFAQLIRRVQDAYGSTTVYPPRENLFACLQTMTPEQVRVVILGQDPYHEPGQANGLAFSVCPGTKLPPSLQNIFKELQSDLDLPAPVCGDLRPWAQQGVLLLNTVLTVEQWKANSHKDYGWQTFTDDIIAALTQLPQPIAFILWGAQAQKKEALIRRSPHPRLILKSPHPSPLSVYRGFYGSRPFSQVNSFLHLHNQPPIDWRLPALEPIDKGGTNL